MLRIGTGGFGLALGCEEFSSFHAYGFALWKSQRCSAEKRLFKYLQFGKVLLNTEKCLSQRGMNAIILFYPNTFCGFQSISDVIYILHKSFDIDNY